MKLTSLTKEQEKRIQQIKDEYISMALTFNEISDEHAAICIESAYRMAELPMPEIRKVCSPFDAQQLANELNKTKNTHYPFGTYLTIGWQSFYAYYDTFVEFGVITEDKFPEYFKLRNFLKSNIFLTIEFENLIIICEKPTKCHRNNTRLHCTTGHAIEWRNGDGLYFINGRNIERKIFEKGLNGLTKKEYLNEKNDEIRSAWYEILGAEKLMELLEANIVDETTIVHKNGEIEKISVFRTKGKDNKIRNEPYAWIKRICPSTSTTYLTPTDPKFNSALEAAKFHRPEWVPKEVDYSWYSRS